MRVLYCLCSDGCRSLEPSGIGVPVAEGHALAQQPRHPGSSRRRGRTVPKGRQVEPAAQAEIRTLLGNAERRRDLLIEFLHLIQDKHGHISAAHLMALADSMKRAQAEVSECST